MNNDRVNFNIGVIAGIINALTDIIGKIESDVKNFESQTEDLERSWTTEGGKRAVQKLREFKTGKIDQFIRDYQVQIDNLKEVQRLVEQMNEQ